MEMNTRLQVEHPVTEAITGLDLVALQFRVAAGEPLPFQQSDLKLDGHAVEARLMPRIPIMSSCRRPAGSIACPGPPDCPGCASTRGWSRAMTSAPIYDPMIAKLIFHAPTRGEALHGLAAALDDTVLLGIRSNRAFLSRLLRHPDFVAGAVDTGFIGRNLAALAAGAPDPKLLVAGIEAWLALVAGIASGSPAALLDGWSLAGIERRDRLHPDDQWREDRGRHRLARSGPAAPSPPPRRCIRRSSMSSWFGWMAGGSILKPPPVPFQAIFGRADGRIFVASPEGHAEIAAEDLTARDAEALAGGAAIKAPMPGKIVRVLTEEGRQVAKGERLIVLEAMKMEHTLSAPRAATVDKVLVSEGEQVQDGKVLVTLSSAEEPV